MKHCDKTAVTVNPTNGCNLRCEYCMASSGKEQGNPIAIPMDFAKKSIHDALNGFPTGIKANMLRFFSPGEPTQRMDIVRECVEYTHSLDPTIKVELQTNGLFRSNEDAKWIANHIDIVWFSLDGPPEINDLHRPDEYGNGRTSEIESNLKLVAEKAAIGVRATVIEETINHQDELVNYFHSLGVSNLGLNPVIRPIERHASGKKDVTRVSIINFAKGFADAYERALQLNMILTSSLTFNFDEPTCIACRSLIPMPQLNPDGSVSSCDMALYLDTKEELSCFLYGRWNQETKQIEYDFEKIENLRNRTINNLSKCKDCEINEYCAGGCAGRVAFQTGDIYGVIPEYCTAIKWLAKRMPLGKRVYELTHP